MSLRVAVLGAGWAGQRHLEAIAGAGGALHAECVVDRDRDQLARVAARAGVGKAYARVEDALADPDVDAVSVCLPHALHHEVAIAAARAGKHVLVEKPMATTVAEAGAMIAAADAAGVRLFVAEQVPYSALSRELRRLARDGAIGHLVCAVVTVGYGDPFGFPGRRAWLADPGAGGTGTWMLHGIHTVAQLRFVLGEVATVYAHMSRTPRFGRTDVEGTVSALLTLESGAPALLVQSVEAEFGGYVLHGTDGTVRTDGDACELVRASGDGREVFACAEPRLAPYVAELLAFADYVNGGAAGPTSARSERRSLAVVEAGAVSMSTGRPVHLAEHFGPL